MPGEATLILDANPSVILNASVMEPLLDLLLGGTETEGDIFSDFESETGLDINSIEYAEMFLDIEALLSMGLDSEDQGSGEAPEIGVVLHGDFDEETLTASIEDAMSDDPGGPPTVENYRGFDIYVDASGGEESLSYSFPEPGTFVFGTGDALRAMLDVAAGVAVPTPAEGREVLDSLGSRHLGLIMRLPPGAMEMATAGEDGEMSLIGSLAPGALNASITVMALRVQDDSLLMRLLQVFDEESAAAASKEFNEGTMMVLGAVSGSAELQQFISGIEVMQQDKAVSYDMTLDEPSVSAILDFLSLLTQMGEGQGQN